MSENSYRNLSVWQNERKQKTSDPS